MEAMNQTDVRKGFWRLSAITLGLALLMATSSWSWMEGRVQKHQERHTTLGMRLKVVMDSIDILESSIDSLSKESARMHEHLDKSDMDDLILDITALISFIEGLPERTTSSTLNIQIRKAARVEESLRTRSAKDILVEYAGALAKVAGHVGEMEGGASAGASKGGPSSSVGGGGGTPAIQSDPPKLARDRSGDQGSMDDCVAAEERLNAIQSEWDESMNYLRRKKYIKDTNDNSGFELRDIGKDNTAILNYLRLLQVIKPMEVPPSRRKG